MQKNVQNTFKDYQDKNENLLNAKVENINLFTKSSKIEVFLESDKELTFYDLEPFKYYLKGKLGVEEAVIRTNMTALEQKEETSEEVKIFSPLIMGRTSKTPVPPINIVDLNSDYHKVVIEGGLVESQSKDLPKINKILLSLNIYDGTSTITCKTFLEVSKAKNIISRVKSSKKLRVEGKLQYDEYIKERVIMINTIVEIPGSDDAREV